MQLRSVALPKIVMHPETVLMVQSIQRLNQGCPIRGPRAACGPRGCFKWPAM